jgi:hypothetical protein
MPQGRHTSLTVRLTPEDRHTLEAWQRSTTIAVGRARRARILLLLAEGRTITEVANTVGMSRNFVYKWAARFRAQGVEGLRDLPRRGACPRVEPGASSGHGSSRNATRGGGDDG